MTTSPLDLLKFSTLLLVLAACGSSGGGGTGSTSGSGGSATTGGDAAPTYTGFVTFSVKAVNAYSGEAGFYTSVSGNACPGGTTQGTCCYQSEAAAQAYGKTIPPDDVSAGAITLRDGARNLASLSFTDGGYTAASSVNTASVTWSAGETLDVSASGDASGVASFAGTVVAPAPLTGVNPALTAGGSLSRTSDFTLAWTTASAGTVSLIISDQTSGDTIGCTATGSSGAMTVPAALLTNLKAGDAVGLVLTTSNSSALSVSNASVELTAEILANGSATVL